MFLRMPGVLPNDAYTDAVITSLQRWSIGSLDIDAAIKATKDMDQETKERWNKPFHLFLEVQKTAGAAMVAAHRRRQERKELIGFNPNDDESMINYIVAELCAAYVEVSSAPVAPQKTSNDPLLTEAEYPLLGKDKYRYAYCKRAIQAKQENGTSLKDFVELHINETDSPYDVRTLQRWMKKFNLAWK
jgi:hypothetical protein